MGGNAKGWLAGLILAASVPLAGIVFAQEPAPDSRVLSNGSQLPAAPGGAAKDAKPAAPDQAQDAKTADKKPAVPDTEAVTPPEPPKAALDEKNSAAPAAEAAPAAAAAAGDAAAESGAASGFLTPSVPSFGADGALRYEYAIDMPGFFGIEPGIALNYDSGRKTKTGGTYQGWLGFGWGMDGIDVIERGRPRGGVPAFDANDVFLLNGGELVPCVAGMDSPSCRYGGNYTTEVESYQRIKRDTAANIWEVTAKDGTKSVFHPVGAFMASPGADANLANQARWLLKSVIDVHGNHVDYNYYCSKAPVCYPNSVLYYAAGSLSTAYRAHFTVEARPDHILMANGTGISDIGHRIKSIEIYANGVIQSSYALTYAQAPSSGTSRLASVTRYGTDVVLDAAANVTSGSALPPVAFTYREFNAAGAGYDTRYANWEKTTPSACTDTEAPSGLGESPGEASKKSVSFLDINNDGADEFLIKKSRCNNVSANKLFVNKLNLTSNPDTIFQNSSDGILLQSSYQYDGNFDGLSKNKSIFHQYGTIRYPEPTSQPDYLIYTAANKLTRRSQI